MCYSYINLTQGISQSCYFISYHSQTRFVAHLGRAINPQSVFGLLLLRHFKGGRATIKIRPDQPGRYTPDMPVMKSLSFSIFFTHFYWNSLANYLGKLREMRQKKKVKDVCTAGVKGGAGGGGAECGALLT